MRIRTTSPGSPTTVSDDRRAEAGFSLIETLAAAALLAGVLISTLTLFIQGGQKVNSGKMMTAAISIAQDIQEQFRELGYQQGYLIIEDAGDPSVDQVYCWDSRGPGDFPQGNGWPRGCGPDGGAGYHEPATPDFRELLGIDTGDADMDGNTGEDGWKRLVAKNLPRGASVTITVRGLNGLGSPPPLTNFRASKVLQVMATVRWRERKRDRSLVFETLKV